MLRTASEEEFRRCLDPRGILIADRLEAPARADAFTVFAQRSDAAFDDATLKRQAEQFFQTRVGLTVAKRYDEMAPLVDAARVVVAPPDEPPGTRLVYVRPRDADDLAGAESVDAKQGSAGLGLLAKRCSMVWLIVVENENDRIALRLAAIVASVLLGPILAPNESELFGVRTARAKLERMSD